jgi:hypothetical protein
MAVGRDKWYILPSWRLHLGGLPSFRGGQVRVGRLSKTQVCCIWSLGPVGFHVGEFARDGIRGPIRMTTGQTPAQTVMSNQFVSFWGCSWSFQQILRHILLCTAESPYKLNIIRWVILKEFFFQLSTGCPELQAHLYIPCFPPHIAVPAGWIISSQILEENKPQNIH